MDEENKQRQEAEDVMAEVKRAGAEGKSPTLQIQATDTMPTAEKDDAEGAEGADGAEDSTEGVAEGAAEGAADGADGADGTGQECSTSSPGIAVGQLTPLQPKLPKERWWLEPKAGDGVGVEGAGAASQVGEAFAAPVQSSAIRKRRWSFAGTRPSAAEEDIGLYPRTMFDELREFYDPLYRLVSLHLTATRIPPALHYQPTVSLHLPLACVAQAHARAFPRPMGRVPRG